MASPSARNMFTSFEYQKPIPEVIGAAKKKIVAIEAKIAEREDRIARIRKEFDISDAELITLFAQTANDRLGNALSNAMSYNLSSAGETRIIAAGVVQNLLTEQQLMEQERDSLNRLRLIVSNLRPVVHFTANGVPYTIDTVRLSEAEIEYLGF